MVSRLPVVLAPGHIAPAVVARVGAAVPRRRPHSLQPKFRLEDEVTAILLPVLLTVTCMS